MKQWIKESTHRLCKTNNPSKKLLSAVTLLYIITSLTNKRDIQLDSFNSEIGFLLNFLIPNVDLDSRTVPDYHLLLSATEQASRKNISQCLRDVLQHRLNIYGPLHPTWICVLPYYHFLINICQPFQKLPPNEAWKCHEIQDSMKLMNPARIREE